MLFTFFVAAESRADNYEGVWTTDGRLSPEQSEALKPYLRELFYKIRHNFFPPADSHPPWISFTVEKNGRVSDMKILLKSNSDLANKLGLDAILKSSPFPPFPENICSTDSLNLEIWFKEPSRTSPPPEKSN